MPGEIEKATKQEQVGGIGPIGLKMDLTNFILI
mgnify:CR=1 FL=1